MIGMFQISIWNYFFGDPIFWQELEVNYALAPTAAISGYSLEGDGLALPLLHAYHSHSRNGVNEVSEC